jgi:hypothetical protein
VLLRQVEQRDGPVNHVYFQGEMSGLAAQTGT